MNRPFFKTGICGVAVLIMSVYLITVFPSKVPSLPHGFITPVLAFEFASDAKDISGIFGIPGTGMSADIVSAMDKGNRIDFLYMVMYTSFLFFFAHRAFSLTGMRVLKAVMIICFIILAGDFMENLQLLAVTGRLQSGDFIREIELLRVFTWMKWGGLAVVSLLLVPYLVHRGKFSRAIAVCGVITFILGLAAFIHRSFLNEIFSMSVGVMFVLLTVYSFLYSPDDSAE